MQPQGAFDQVPGIHGGFKVQGEHASTSTRAEVRKNMREQFMRDRAIGIN